MNFPARGACTPYALASLFRESFYDSCRRIHAAGGDYQSVTGEVLHRILGTKLIKRVQEFTTGRPTFSAWRRYRRGTWVAVVTCHGRNGHCVTLRDRVAYDNGWVSCHGVDKVYVCAAWQLGKD